AYHITWGTYGTRLHGDQRPTVDGEHNQYGQPFVAPDKNREDEIRRNLAREPVYLTLEQRKLVEETLREVADRYDWIIHAIAAQSDHVHIVISAPRIGDDLREALKACASRALNKSSGKKKWWAEGGSDKWLFEDEYFEEVRRYVFDQRDF